MTQDLQDLARAAHTQPRPSTHHVPEYRQIVRESRVVRVFAALCALSGALCWIAAVAVTYLVVTHTNQELRRVAERMEQEQRTAEAAATLRWSPELAELHRRDMDLRTWRLATWGAAVAAVAAGMLLFVAAALLRLAAWSAVALRDLTRNSYAARPALAGPPAR